MLSDSAFISKKVLPIPDKSTPAFTDTTPRASIFTKDTPASTNAI
ncbi:hypothetical protein [Coprobacter sp.]